MTDGIAAVQARIMDIQSRFPSPVAPYAGSRTASAAPGAQGYAPPPAPDTAGTLFAQTLASSGPATASSATTSAATSSATGTAATTGTAAAPAASTVSGGTGVTGEQVVARAKQHLGTPYVWGGAKPGGFDCSGLMQWSYKQMGIDLPRVSRDQAKVGRPVSPAEAQPGDLVFFARQRPAPDHIGMYAGNGQWVVAPRTGDVVKMQKVDLSKATTIRRVLPDAAPAGAPAAPAPAAAVRSAAPYAALCAETGARHGVSPALLTAVARAESGFNPAARSPAGAQGLMQLMPETARSLGADPWQPASAVDGAARLLKQHLQRFGSTELALAAYNAGPGAVTKHGGIPPYRETESYVRKIMAELRTGSA
jgi:peptidoglycan DL-endopeptidase CwlO